MCYEHSRVHHPVIIFHDLTLRWTLRVSYNIKYLKQFILLDLQHNCDFTHWCPKILLDQLEMLTLQNIRTQVPHAGLYHSNYVLLQFWQLSYRAFVTNIFSSVFDQVCIILLFLLSVDFCRSLNFLNSKPAHFIMKNYFYKVPRYLYAEP